ETHSRPPRCSDSAPGARTRASSGCTSTTTDPSRPIRNATTAAAASHPSHFALALVARTRAPACGTPRAGGRDGHVAGEVLDRELEERPRGIADPHLCVADTQHVLAAQIALGVERAAVETHRCSRGGLDEPDAAAAPD